MTTKDMIKKLSVILGLFLTAVGSMSKDSNFILVGILLTIIGEAMFLLK